MTGVLIRRWVMQKHRQREDHVTPEPEIRVMQLQTKEWQGLMANTGS